MSEIWAKKLYMSKAWKDLRLALIIQREAVCERCGRDYKLRTEQLVGHHKIELTPDNVSDPGIALNPDNVEIICMQCHNREHERFGAAHVQHVYIVYGSPCSGKTSLVNQMSERGDLIIDMDSLYQAVSGCDKYDKPNRLKRNVFKLVDELVDQVRIRYGYWRDAYIIGGYPRKVEREYLAERLNAELVYCQATKEECLARTVARGPFADDWRGYVERWWDEYQQ